MHVSHSHVTTDKVEWGGDVIGKGFGKCRHLCKHSLCNLLHGTRGETCVLHLLRSYIVWLHTHLRELKVFCLFYLRMSELESASENGRLAENDIVNPNLEVLGYVLCS